MCSNFVAINLDLKSVGAPQQDDVGQRSAAHATEQKPDDKAKSPDEEIPAKKRKTRRGKNKRRHHPYHIAHRKTSTVVKPDAPHNSNQFLIEDHGHAIELDEKIMKEKNAVRTRDSSFSVDSDGEFYSSPDDEEEFLIKDFDDQYESLHAERLHSMSKTELIQEYLQLEKKVEVLTKRLRSKSATLDVSDGDVDMPCSDTSDFKKQMEHLINENELLKRENNDLRSKVSVSDSGSEDSESDSSETCSSCSANIRPKSESMSPSVDYSQTNGHSPENLQSV